MASIGRHTGSCAAAVGRVCKCSGCGGSEHGWIGGLALAVPTMAPALAHRSERAETQWRESFNPADGKSNARNRAAAVDAAKYGLIHHLAGLWGKGTGAAPVPQPALPDTEPAAPDPVAEIQKLAKVPSLDDATVKGIADLGAAIVRPTIKEIDKQFVASARALARKQLADHFWCDLFASLAQSIQLFETTLSKVPERAADAVVKSSFQPRRRLITKPVVRLATKCAWRAVDQAIEHATNLKKILFALRFLAVLSCPAPEKHRAVVQHCLVPLGSQALEDELKSRLRAVLPEELTKDLHLGRAR